MNLENYLNEIVTFLQEQVKITNTKGLVVGLSGGIDSAVVALLIKKACPENNLSLIMPCFSPKEDLIYAENLALEHNLNYKIIDLSQTFNQFKLGLGAQLIEEKEKLVFANFKARLRMATLYAWAQNNNYLVVGTDNADEWYTGYFTKYGDGGVDILPIIHLLKKDVVAAAKLLKVSPDIINRPPSANLWEGQTDEQEMGFTYHDLDNYLLGKRKELSAVTIEKIEKLHKISEHKRKPVPQAPEWKK